MWIVLNQISSGGVRRGWGCDSISSDLCFHVHDLQSVVCGKDVL